MSVLVAEFTKTLAALDRSMRFASLSDRRRRSLGSSRRSIATSAAPCRGSNSPSALDFARVEAERRARDAGAARFRGVGKGDRGGRPFVRGDAA